MVKMEETMVEMDWVMEPTVVDMEVEDQEMELVEMADIHQVNNLDFLLLQSFILDTNKNLLIKINFFAGPSNGNGGSYNGGGQGGYPAGGNFGGQGGHEDSLGYDSNANNKFGGSQLGGAGGYAR